MSAKKDFDIAIENLGPLMRSLNKAGKEFNAALKDESRTIADRLMVPAYKDAANRVPSWGPKLSDSIRSQRDRFPVVVIGKKSVKYSGGANATMLRSPTFSGKRRKSWAPFVRTNWIGFGKVYKRQALREWGQALERVTDRFNRGMI